MKKKFLGIVCLIYSGIITYLLIFDKLKNFLAPQMQIYVKVSLIPLLVIGLIIVFTKDNHYNFKIVDLVLLLPLVLIITAGDGRLSSSFASNRTTNFNADNRTKTTIIEEDTMKDSDYDFSKPYFNIMDSNYIELSNYITFEAKATKFVNKTIKVRGFALTDETFLPKGYFALGKYAITCCAADSEFTGFYVKYDTSKIDKNKWYEVEGVLTQGKDKEGYSIIAINVINIKEIYSQSEEQYVYPCYAYSDNACEKISEYNLEY